MHTRHTDIDVDIDLDLDIDVVHASLVVNAEAPVFRLLPARRHHRDNVGLLLEDGSASYVARGVPYASNWASSNNWRLPFGSPSNKDPTILGSTLKLLIFCC